MAKYMTHPERRERRRRIAAQASAGYKIAALCQQFDVGPHTVIAACHEHDVPVPKDDPAENATRLVCVSSYKILRRLLDGVERKAVAVEFGVSKQRVSQIKQRAEEAGFTFEKPTQGESHAD